MEVLPPRIFKIKPRTIALKNKLVCGVPQKAGKAGSRQRRENPPASESGIKGKFIRLRQLKNVKNYFSILLLCLFAGIGIGYYFGYDHGWERAIYHQKPAELSSYINDVDLPRIKEYTNRRYGFNVQYPNDWRIDEVYFPPSDMAEPWKSFIFYIGFTPPRGQDHYAFIAVSQKTSGEIQSVLGSGDNHQLISKDHLTYIIDGPPKEFDSATQLERINLNSARAIIESFQLQ